MAVVAMVAGDQALPNTTTYASWGTAGLARAFLAADFAEDSVVRIESTGASSRIEVLTASGRRLGFVEPKKAAYVILKNTTDDWFFDPKPADYPAFVAAAGATYTATEQGIVNAMRTAMINAGLLKAE